MIKVVHGTHAGTPYLHEYLVRTARSGKGPGTEGRFC